MAEPKTHKLLQGTQAIAVYLSCSRNTVHNFIKMGMPAKYINGKWYAWTDNVDMFFQKITAVSNRDQKDLPEDVDGSACEENVIG